MSIILAKLATLATLAVLGLGAYVENQVDAGNGVHVPGQIPANPLDPLQHRIAFAGPSGMTVSWSTFEQLPNPQVFYGLSPGDLSLLAENGTSTTYPTSRTWNNHVKLSGLKSGTVYFYRVSYTNCAYCAYRPTYSFKTALAAGDHTPFAMATIADLGLMGHDGLSTKTGPLATVNRALYSNETNTIQSLNALKDTYELIGHYGDIGYADYFLKESTQGYFGNTSDLLKPNQTQDALRYESLSEQFFDQLQPITAEKPWMVSPGNHEANCDNGLAGYGDSYCLVGQTNFTFYIEHFRMPTQESHQTNNFWYSYDYGMAHMISLNTETDLGVGLSGPIANISTNHNGPFGGLNEQVDWLISDLKAVNRTKTPWVIVGLHRPWYTQVSPPTWPAWQEAFEQIFYDYEVDLYMNGHVHTYERMHPIFNGTIDPNGLNNPRAPWMLLLGNAGHYDGLDTFTTNQSYTAYGNDQVFGWGRLTFEDAQHLSFEFINSATSEVIDSATLYKEHKLPAPVSSASSSTHTSASSTSGKASSSSSAGNSVSGITTSLKPSSTSSHSTAPSSTSGKSALQAAAVAAEAKYEAAKARLEHLEAEVVAAKKITADLLKDAVKAEKAAAHKRRDVMV